MSDPTPIGSQKSVIGAGARFSGYISPASILEVHGIVKADVIADTLEISDSGHITGNAEIGLCVVHGEFKGRLNARSVWLMKTARISGEIEYGALQMDRGAALNCHILHNWEGATSDEMVELPLLNVENRGGDE